MSEATPSIDRSARSNPPRHPAALALALAGLLLWPQTARSAGESDIALFSTANGAPPNIMLMLDDSGSMEDEPSWCGGGGWGGWGWGWGWGDDDDDGGSDDPTCDGREKWELMRDAAVNLVTTINSPDGAGGYADGARFGIFMFDSNHHGGELIVPIADDNTQAVLDALNNDINPDGSTPLGGTLVDIGRYYAGSAGWGSGLTALPDFGTLNYDDGSSEQSVSSPMDLECRESFVLALSDGDGQDTDGAKYPNLNLWMTVGDADGDGDETLLTAEEWMDDAAYAMYRYDFAPGVSGTQNVETHTIAFDLDGSGATLLENAADYGGGTYHAANAGTTLDAAFLSAAANIFASLGSFTGATVTASRTGKGDLFINSYFEPTDHPVWAGHLEAFRIAPDGEIQGLDTSGGTPVYVPALDPTTFKIVAPPIWDAGSKILDESSRTILTSNSTYTGTIAVTTANLTAAELGIDDTDYDDNGPAYDEYPNAASSGINTRSELETALVRYVHGKDGFDENTDGSKTDLRDPMLGDIFHSTPLTVGPPTTLLASESGYNGFLSSYDTRDRVVYVGANDGMLHAFDAGEFVNGDDPLTTDVVEIDHYSFGTGANGVNGGEEIWGYVPRRLVDELRFLPLNAPRTRYFVDGSPVAADVWLGDKAGGTAKVKDANEWATAMVVGMRDGARSYLALDVTDPSAGTYPKLLWEFTHDALGDAWSKPVITRVKVEATSGYGDHCGNDDGDGDCKEQWVAIFGGGFKSNADPNDTDFGPDSTSPNWTHRSKGVFVVSLDTGALLSKVVYDETGANGPDNMLYAMPASPTVLDLDFDGFADVVYIGDLGGQMWKWDVSEVGTFSGGEVTNWPYGVFFSSPSTDMGTGVTRYRSFFTSPAAAYVRGTLVLAWGSGEREDLFYGGSSAHAENNRLYVINDFYPTGGSAFASTKTEADSDITDVTDGTNNPGVSGYYITLPDGEKIVSDPTIFAGYVVATSFQPEPGSNVCTSASGEAFLYVFDIGTGEGYFDDGTADPEPDRRMMVGTGMPSSPKVSLGSDPTDDVIYIKTSTGQVVAVDPPPRSDQPVGLIYWRQIF